MDDQDFGRKALRWGVRALVVLIIASGLVWFFFLRSSGKQANTSADATSPDTVAAASQSEDVTAKGDGDKTSAASTTAGSKEALPNSGPADVAVIFAVAAVAGTLAWEWRLRRSRQQV